MNKKLKNHTIKIARISRGASNPPPGTKFSRTILKYKRVFAELEKLYNEYYDQFQRGPLFGWTWWSLPPKMWRIAKSLGFKNDEFNHEWVFYNTLSGCGDYSASSAAQKTALKILRERYPGDVLLQDISSGGRLD